MHHFNKLDRKWCEEQGQTQEKMKVNSQLASLNDLERIVYALERQQTGQILGLGEKWLVEKILSITIESDKATFAVVGNRSIFISLGLKDRHQHYLIRIAYLISYFS